jgi:hypothetical protein
MIQSSARLIKFRVLAERFDKFPTWDLVSWPYEPPSDRHWYQAVLYFDCWFESGGGWITLPHWFLAASSLGLAALLAFTRTWRYSLRTILVATTVVAGLLGLAVWAV